MDTTTRNAIVTEALDWLGTPFVHCGREKGVGVDCVGLVICVYHTVGLLNNFDYNSYSTFAPEGTTRNMLLRFCDPLMSLDMALKGDLLLFRIHGYEQHVAIVTENGGGRICHAFQSPGVVAEHETNSWWRNHITGVFQFQEDRNWQL